MRAEPGAGLARELAASVRGEVRFDDGHRAPYATDASNYRQVPLGVVLPRDADDLIAAVAACRNCREKIAQLSGRSALHLAEELRLALDSH